MKKYIPEILEECGKLETRLEMIEFLKKHKSSTLEFIFRHMLFQDEKINIEIPDYLVGTDKWDFAYSDLTRQLKTLKLLESDTLNEVQVRRKMLSLFESVHKQEAELLEHMFNQTLPYKWISKFLYKKVFTEEE